MFTGANLLAKYGKSEISKNAFKTQKKNQLNISNLR